MEMIATIMDAIDRQDTLGVRHRVRAIELGKAVAVTKNPCWETIATTTDATVPPDIHGVKHPARVTARGKLRVATMTTIPKTIVPFRSIPGVFRKNNQPKIRFYYI